MLYYIFDGLVLYVCIFIWIKGTGYNPRDHTHQDISLVHCADPGPFPVQSHFGDICCTCLNIACNSKTTDCIEKLRLFKTNGHP